MREFSDPELRVWRIAIRRGPLKHFNGYQHLETFFWKSFQSKPVLKSNKNYIAVLRYADLSTQMIFFVVDNCFYISWILPFVIVYPEWGSAGQTYNRFLPNAYQDGTSEPRGGRHPSSLPNPRWVSQRNHPDSDIPDYRFTHMVMQFGQFLDHDITMTPKDGKWWEVAWFCFANVPNKIMCLCRRNKLLSFWSSSIKLFYYTHT